MKVIILVITAFILLLFTDIFMMLLYDTSIFLGWDYFTGNFRWRPSLAWYSYITHHVLVILVISYLLAVMVSEKMRRYTTGFIIAASENATCLISNKFKHLPLSIRITSTLIMLYVFYMFFIANYRELLQLISALAIGDGYWGNMHASSFGWGILATTLAIFILGTLMANGLLKQNRVAFWSVVVLFTGIVLSIIYYSGSSIYILSTTEDTSAQPIGLSSHLRYYVYLIIYSVILSIVIPLLKSLGRNRALFQK